MSTYFLAPALVEFRDEIDKKFPGRDKASDGWIGDPSHAARVSDHNPDWGDPEPYTGIVRAIDVDNNGALNEVTPLVKAVLNAAIGDPRVWYVIYARKIYSRTYGWVAKPYTGTNPHDHHVHISLLHRSGEFNTASWFPQETKPIKIKPQPVSVAGVRAQFLAARDGKPVQVNNGVARIQNQLRKRFNESLAVDGIAGRKTLDAWGRYEDKVGGLGGHRIPDKKSLARLAAGRFMVVK